MPSERALLMRVHWVMDVLQSLYGWVIQGGPPDCVALLILLGLQLDKVEVMLVISGESLWIVH